MDIIKQFEKELKMKCRRDTRRHIYHKFDVTVIVNLVPMGVSSSVFLEQSMIFRMLHMIRFAALCTEAVSCRFFFPEYIKMK